MLHVTKTCIILASKFADILHVRAYRAARLVLGGGAQQG
jgi:hypothetical protein